MKLNKPAGLTAALNFADHEKTRKHHLLVGQEPGVKLDANATIKLPEGIKMPMVGFGTLHISSSDCEKTITAAIEAGYRHIDTAECYRIEEGIGRTIRDSIGTGKITREECFISTKLWPGSSEWGQKARNEKTTINALNESLARLDMEYVDLYLIHAPMKKQERLAQWRGLLALQQQGKARAIGVSNYSWRHIEEIKATGLPLPALNQIELHPWAQRPALVDYLRDQGVIPMAYSSLLPLSTWRAHKGQFSAKTDKMKTDGLHEHSLFKRIAAKYGVSESQLLLRWAVQQGYPVIPKSTNPKRMRQNLNIFDFKIDAVDMVLMSTANRGGGVSWASGDPSKQI